MVAVDAPSPLRASHADRQFRELANEIADLSERPSWHARAACRGMTDLFIPQSTAGWAVAPALEVCESCSVIEECRAASVTEVDGIWRVWCGSAAAGGLEKVAS